MNKVLLLLALFGFELYALSLNDVISQALEKNPSLKSLQHKILANKSATDISNQFLNPVLSFSTDTLDANEKMHKQTLNIQQKISFYKHSRLSLQESLCPSFISPSKRTLQVHLFPTLLQSLSD